MLKERLHEARQVFSNTVVPVTQCAKKEMSDSLRMVEGAIHLVMPGNGQEYLE